jgi:hypothetical protein
MARRTWDDVGVNEQEATRLADELLAELRAEDFESLERRIGEPEWRQIDGTDAVTYRAQVQTFWDDVRERRNLRVMVAVDDGSRGFIVRPITRDFIVAPDGSFVGEE